MQEYFDIDEIKTMIARDYVDNFDEEDTPTEVIDWLTDTYPDFKLKLNIEYMGYDLDYKQVLQNDVIEITNYDELSEYSFSYDEENEQYRRQY